MQELTARSLRAAGVNLADRTNNNREAIVLLHIVPGIMCTYRMQPSIRTCNALLAELGIEAALQIEATQQV
jgi:hypothetical protein